MPITRNNFTSLPVAAEQEGVDVSFFTVDFIADVSAEVGDPQADSTVAGLALVQNAIMNLGINILATGPLGNSDTELTYMVRTDSLDVANHITANGIRDAIRAVDTAGRAAGATPRNTANFSSATVTAKDVYIAV
jgi:hypothetical protein